MTIEEHLELGRKWLESQSGIVYCNGTYYFGDEVFGFCDEVVVGDGRYLYVCGEFCGEYDSISDMVEDIVSGDNQKAIAVLRKNEREIEVGDWCMKKIEMGRDILRTYGKGFWVRHDGNRICLMVDSEDYGVKVGDFLGIGSDWQGGLYAFNEEILDVLDRLCEKGTLEYYKKWKFIWDLLIDSKMMNWGKIKSYKLGDNQLELIGDNWDGDEIETLVVEKDGRKIIEFDSFEELESMIRLVKR